MKYKFKVGDYVRFVEPTLRKSPLWGETGLIINLDSVPGLPGAQFANVRFPQFKMEIPLPVQHLVLLSGLERAIKKAKDE